MRRLLAGLALAGLLGTLSGCYYGRGMCDCYDYEDPCCYGPHGCCVPLYGPGPHGGHLPAGALPAASEKKVEPLPAKPKEADKEPAKEQTEERLPPPAIQ